MGIPQTIQIYLPQGDPAGIRMAEITTRTVRLFEVPRTLLSGFRAMVESKQVGLYFLFGSTPEGRALAYVGQSGNVGDRIKNHEGKKEFWDKALVAVSLTNSWTSTHVSYMEWQSIRKATSSGRYELDNDNSASNPHTPAPLESDCQEYLATISVLMTTLGYPLMDPLVQPQRPDQQNAPEMIFVNVRGAELRGYSTPEGVVVLAGSYGRAQAAPSAATSILNYRQRLIDQGIAAAEDGRYTLVKDHLFGSPSTAAAVMVGASMNGRVTWKNAAGLTFQEIEDRKLAATE
ncbi:GIY-YIG nuclease family protein [Paenarthrobacter sp. C1]|uniref:GIY-YIG nuclease family protein n=1 Tax=Paenarthrobacter sp. C1 TaxID=3400220 RepID=UPI003BF5B73A